MSKTLVIAAFPGTGKTYFTKNTKHNVLDSDSSAYSKANDFPENYINHIKDNIGKMRVIFVSTHKIVRDAMVKEGIEFTLIYPEITEKEEYISRYKNRGNNEKFIELLNENWTSWILEMDHQKGCGAIRLRGKETITDLMNIVLKPERSVATEAK